MYVYFFSTHIPGYIFGILVVVIPFRSFLLGLSVGTPKPLIKPLIKSLIGCPRARQPPNALVVHLKRFAGQGRELTKTKTQIGFGESLAVKVSGPEGRAVYDLTGCVQLHRVMCRVATVGSQICSFCRVCEEGISISLCVFTTSSKCKARA